MAAGKRAKQRGAPAGSPPAATVGAFTSPALADRQDESLVLGGHPALLRMPAAPTALYVFAHGAGAGMRHSFMTSIASRLAARGIATLRWEFPYMAAGKPRPDRPEVAEAAVQHVWAAARARFAPLPMFAGGKSFGGRMTSRAHAASALPGVRGLIFFGFPLHPPDKPSIQRAEHLIAADGPMLFLQGDRDELAGLRRLRPVVRKLGMRAQLHVVKHADHGFEVLVRSGRTPADVLDELGDAAHDWIAQLSPGRVS